MELILSYVELRLIPSVIVSVEFIDLLSDCREALEDFLDPTEDRFLCLDGVVETGNLEVEERGEGVSPEVSSFFQSPAILLPTCFLGLPVTPTFFSPGVELLLVLPSDFLPCREPADVFLPTGVEGLELFRRLALLSDFFKSCLLPFRRPRLGLDPPLFNPLSLPVSLCKALPDLFKS